MRPTTWASLALLAALLFVGLFSEPRGSVCAPRFALPPEVVGFAAAAAERCAFAGQAEWAVFLHSNPANDWRTILDDQVKTIHASPLHNCGAAGIAAALSSTAARSRAAIGTGGAGRVLYGFQRGTPWPYAADAGFAPYNESATTLHVANSERTTLQPLWEWCAARPHALVAYVHDKGTRTSAAENPERYLRQWDWRRLHEYFVLEVPEGCFTHLLDEGYDTCGANLRLDPFVHFSGNFWWARCAYIAQLEAPATYREGDELAPERWIGSLDERGGGRSARHFECFNSGVVHSFARYPRSEYLGKTCE